MRPWWGAMLEELIDGWLSAPAHRLAVRFPPRLEQRFEADTGAERSRSIMVFGAIGFLFGTLLFPVLQANVPEAAAQVRLLYLEISMPLGFAVSALMWLQPPPVLREGLTLLAHAVCICVTMYIFAISHSADAPFFVGGVTVLLVYSTVGVQLRFLYALFATLLIIISYALALHAHPDISASEQRSLVVIAAANACYLMLANWRLERAHRRSYLMMLRERLQRQDLSLRNIELDELSRRDPLTGLANRRAYDTWLAAAWAQEAASAKADADTADFDKAAPDKAAAEKAGRGRLGLIVIDVDRFKAFNDFYGHAAGDACLKKIAVCLRDQLRGTTDLVARLGGEEFAVLLPSLSEANSADVAERMRLAVQRLELPHSGLGPHGLVTVSAGVASTVILHAPSPAALFEAADSALYEAKISGRNRVCVATEAPKLSEQAFAS